MNLPLDNIIFGYTWIYKITPNQWNIALDACKLVLSHLHVSNDDPKLTLTITETSPPRCNLIFGNKYAGGFYVKNDKVVLRFYVNPDFDIQSDERLLEKEHEFKNSSGKLINCIAEDWKGNDDPLNKIILAGAELAYSQAGISNYSRYHLPFLYDAIFDEDSRKEWIDLISSDPQDRILKAYKIFLQNNKNVKEIYKWDLAIKFKQHWNLEATDFASMLKNIDFSNLISGQSDSFLKEAQKNPEDAKSYYQLVFDDSIPVNERFKRCKQEGDRLIKKWHPGWISAGQDERTISWLLSFNDLATYAPYKSSFYTKYCKYIDVKGQSPGSKYSHYLELIKDFVDNQVKKDKELISMHNSTLSEDAQKIDYPNFHLLAQNILFVVFDQIWKSEESHDEEFTTVDTENISIINPDKQQTNPMNKPINQILYGPPGTGKTFNLKDKYFPQYTTKETSITPERHFENIVRELTWWQVLAIALIEGGVQKVNDIALNKWVKMKASLSESKNVNATIWGTLQMHTVSESKTVSYAQRQAPLIFDKSEDKTWMILDSEAKDQVPELFNILNSVNNYIPDPEKEIKRYAFITFHQSFTYEDFIEGIKPTLSEGMNNGELIYHIEDGIFKFICKQAESDPENRYAIFIDEINRGNVSGIFGELITLIEQDKRKGGINEMSTILPYSKKSFSVPSNLDIYGTMNTADRSIEALDTALRRRFSFKEIMPEPSLLNNNIIAGINLSEMLSKINERIEVLIDRDHTIGHAFFMGVNDINSLQLVFKNNIIPLLQEYFYGDYGKIGLVLGSGFVLKSEKTDLIFSSFEYDNRENLLNPGYNLIAIDDNNFEFALHQLMT
ncbi:MAG: AAA family ATPase [Saprospiraceae bacterium]|nr:AAA family ATPase [Saprospiraceae bacterium]